jgi:hypothetical protein
MTATQSVAGTRNRRVVGLVVVLAVLTLVVLAILTRDQAEFAGSLDPRNPQASGAQAVARVLADHGVSVTVVRGQGALLDQPVDASTEVVVTNPGELGPSTLQRLRSHARAAGALAMIGQARVLGAQLDLRTGLVPAGSRPAACQESLARRLVVRAYGGEGLKVAGCFGESDTSLLARSHGFWLLASPTSISNRHVLEKDNAALALRLLGQHERLLWYVADSTDLGSGEGLSLSRLLPPWLGPGAILLVVGVLALMLLRGRRLGPLVTEPLPVVVRAVESTTARGRIYRRTGDRDHAAAILVQATRRRIGETLGLPPQTRVEAVADAAAARSGRDPRLVRELLSTTTVPTNARLTELGSRLIELENEVREP